MLTRVVVVGKDKAAGETLSKTLDGDRALVAPLEKAGQAPPGAAAFIVGSADDPKALQAAVHLIGQHEEILDLLALSIDCREMAATGSSKRVHECAAAFGKVMQLESTDQFVLERGALLRDIGKLMVPNEVLLKKGVLTYDEWETIRKHTHFGADLVKQTQALSDIEDIARRHHECYDGDGYPDGLEKDEIPFLARMVKIIDVYCAMTSPRHYRATVSSHDAAVNYLTEEAGKHFDPEFVKAFVKGKVGVKK